MSFISINDVEWKAEEVLATEPKVTQYSDGDYVRWELELFRRRLVRSRKAMEEAEAAFAEASKGGGPFSKAELEAHTAAFNKADTNRSNKRAAFSGLVDASEGFIRTAKIFDEIVSDMRRDAQAEAVDNQRICHYAYMTSALSDSPEEKRNAALLEAEKEYIQLCEDAAQDAYEGRRGGRKRSGRVNCGEANKRFEERKAQIEEEYYAAELAKY